MSTRSFGLGASSIAVALLVGCSEERTVIAPTLVPSATSSAAPTPPLADSTPPDAGLLTRVPPVASPPVDEPRPNDPPKCPPGESLVWSTHGEICERDAPATVQPSNDVDRGALAAALAVSTRGCAAPGQTGSGAIVVTFASDGRVTDVSSSGTLGIESAAKCVADRYRKVRTRPWKNPPLEVKVRKSFAFH